MSRNRDDWVSQRAYAIWEGEGRPHGRGESHWAQALREFEQLEATKASADGSDLIEKLKAAGRLMRVCEEPVFEVKDERQRKAVL
ncbi:hypothetical protein FHX08_005040 [Rhizobium sp. BK529]|uniref:DUF2934 domain-containing protein n=1 Tax=unclassified Rhizobium TaxID=2613769 RepID=UPI00104F1AA0|nr:MULTISPECIES: DUF2934 domain-containing protein [unclassified Rhizobium]MBB3594636.1 hypothetical protein [Rhizobium sp. BK529]TCS02377.1 DUF2934 family protein [Rhizobium sp. BK418]